MDDMEVVFYIFVFVSIVAFLFILKDEPPKHKREEQRVPSIYEQFPEPYISDACFLLSGNHQKALPPKKKLTRHKPF